MIKGQSKLLNIVSNFTLDTLPHTILLEGLKGSGKHSIVSYMADKLNLQIEDISGKLTMEMIEEINNKIAPYIYIIDASNLNEKNENSLLKFLEEPLKNAYIFVLCNNKYDLIETIRNRCYLLTMEKYSNEVLSEFVNSDHNNKDLILMIAETPGEVISLQQYDLKEMLNLADKILDKISIASFSNTLSLTNKIAFNNEKDKFDFNLFFKLLQFCSKQRVINNFPKSITSYYITEDYYNRTHVNHIDKKQLFENYLFTLKIEMMKG